MFFVFHVFFFFFIFLHRFFSSKKKLAFHFMFFFSYFFFACVSFHLLLFFKKIFTFGTVKGNARDGRSRHQPTNQSFRVCKVNLATRNVAIKAAAMDRIGRDEDGSQFGERLAASRSSVMALSTWMSSATGSVMEAFRWVCTRVQENHEWISEFTMVMQENEIWVQ